VINIADDFFETEVRFVLSCYIGILQGRSPDCHRDQRDHRNSRNQNENCGGCEESRRGSRKGDLMAVLCFLVDLHTKMLH